MKIRAKTKSIENIDPKFLCCPPTIEWFKKDHPIIEGDFDIDNLKKVTFNCSWCGKEHILQGALQNNGGRGILIELSDIDEGVIQ